MPKFSSRHSQVMVIALSAVVLAGAWGLLRTSKTHAPDNARQTAEAHAENVMPATTSPRTQSATRPQPRRTTDAPQPLSATPEPGDPYLGTSFLAIEPGYDPHTLFDEVGEEFQVPASLLKAVAYTESRLLHGSGSANEHGARGLMGLRETDTVDTLNEAATLLALTPTDLVRDPVQNTRGAAAVLRQYHQEAQQTEGLDGDPWSLALARYSGLPSADAVTYAQTIANILHEGMEHTLDDGTTIGIDAGGR